MENQIKELFSLWHQQQIQTFELENKILELFRYINSNAIKKIHYDLALKVGRIIEANKDIKDLRELPEVSKIWIAMDVIKENYLIEDTQ